MSWFSRFTSRIRRLFKRPVEIEIPIEPEFQPPPIISGEEQPILEAPPREELEPELPEEIEEAPEEAKENLIRMVTFEERIRGTRIKRTMTKTYPISTSESDIKQQLSNQYDAGGNFVINVNSFEVISGSEYEENEIDRGVPGSADDSP